MGGMGELKLRDVIYGEPLIKREKGGTSLQSFTLNLKLI